MVGLVGFTLRDELGRNIHSGKRKIEVDIGDRKLQMGGLGQMNI